MSREEDVVQSRKALLDDHERRYSFEDEDDIDLDVIDPNDHLPEHRRTLTPLSEHKMDRLISQRKVAAQHGAAGKKKGGCLRSKRFWVAIVLLLTLVIALSVNAKRLVKKFGPPDGRSPPWYPTPRGGTIDAWKGSYEKASKMVGNMTLVEKVNITTGTGWATNLCVGNTGSASRVGFPMLCLQDGPLGIRFADNATVWPAGITVAATWSKDLMYQRGRGLGLEHKGKGINVALAPCMGPLGRMPAGGRNWEAFGPDPVLAGIASAQTIKGIQDEGVIATAKHFIGNEQEHFRQAWEWGTPYAISSNIDDRTLHELYLWPFADSVRAGVASVMCSYNMINSSYGCGNSKLMNGILKDELGFQGFVQSDWLAQRSGVASALAGLDMSMPGDGLSWNDRAPLWGSRLTEAVLNGSVPVERINDMATRIIAAWYKLGQDNQTDWPMPPPDGGGGPNFSSFTKQKIGRIHDDTGDTTTAQVNYFVDVQGSGNDSHADIARKIAAEGIVLVKNDNKVLPLSRKGKSSKSDVKYRVGIYGEDAGSSPSGLNSCPDQSCNVGTLGQGWGSGAADYPFLTTPEEALTSNLDGDAVQLTAILRNHLSKDEVNEAKQQDVCLVFVNSDSGEGFLSWNHITDRNDLFTQKGGDQLVKTVADNCEQTIVIVHAVGAVVVERWIDHRNVKAVLLAHLPGEVSGSALVDVLFGDVDASGRLPYTIGKSLKDYGPGGQIMYKPNGIAPHQDFDEGLSIDYRHFDARNFTPRFEFGFGLSYTTFAYSNLALETLKSKEPLPSPRPSATAAPTYPTTVPDPSEAMPPPDFVKIDRYIYPYLANTSILSGSDYPYPTGYTTQQAPSPAGGGEGGNPSLYDEHLAISVDITNTGDRDGKDVVQVYVSLPRTIDESTGQEIRFPRRVLRAFEKVDVSSGETQTIKMNLTRRDLSYWSVGMQNWVMPDGSFVLHVGASSRNLPLNATW